MTPEELTAEALQLDQNQRAALAESLLNSLDSSADLSEKDTLELARQRDHDLETGKEAPLSHKEVMRGLRKPHR